jgi:hypothetical protein
MRYLGLSSRRLRARGTACWLFMLGRTVQHKRLVRRVLGSDGMPGFSSLQHQHLHARCLRQPTDYMLDPTGGARWPVGCERLSLRAVHLGPRHKVSGECRTGMGVLAHRGLHAPLSRRLRLSDRDGKRQLPGVRRVWKELCDPLWALARTG